MPDGTGHGAFALTDSLYAGYYELRAYTRWMLNFGQYEHPHSKWTELMFYFKSMAKDFFGIMIRFIHAYSRYSTNRKLPEITSKT